MKPIWCSLLVLLSISTGRGVQAQSKTGEGRLFTIYGTLNRPLPSLSGSWVDTEQGVGMAWGAGGGVQTLRPLTNWLAAGITADYGQWQVRRRFFEAGTLKYSSDQTMRQLALMATIRFYPTPNLFVQPMAGGQVLQITHAFSDGYPGRSGTGQTRVFRPAVGGWVGYAFGREQFMSKIGVSEIALRYQLTPNRFLQTLDGPLHTVGLQIGVGF